MATLTSTKIKNTYDALLKSIDNDAIGTTAKQITDGLGNTTPLYVSTTQVGIGVTPESGLNLHVFGDAKIGSNLTVIGNLVVEGSTTTVGTDTLTVKDPLIVLANNNTSTDAVDIGFYGKYTPSGTTLYSGLFREALTGKYRLFKGLEDEPTTTVNTSGTGYAVATLVSNLEGNVTGNVTGNLTGNVTGNVTGGTISGTTGTFSGNVDIDGTLDVDDVISVEGSAFGRIEIGGASGGYVDLKAPNSDDYDLRLITSVGGAELLSIDTLKFYTGATTDLAFSIDASQNATFEGNLNVDKNLILGTSVAATVGRIKLGAGGEIQLYFDNTDSYLYNISSGDLNILSDQTVFIGNSAANETYAKFIQDGSVELYYNNSKKFETTNTGVSVTGNINLGDNSKIIFGDGGDIEMFFDGGTFVIDDTSEVQQGIDIDTNIVRFRGTDLYAELGNAQHTFWTTGTQRLQINSSGVTIGGDLTVDLNTLFVDASANSVGINLTNPSDYTADELVISVPDGSGMTLVSGATDAAYITFMSSTGAIATNGGFIGYDHDADGLTMFAQSQVSIAIQEAVVAYFTDTAFFVDKNTTFAGQVIASSSSSGDYVRMYGGSGTGQWDIYGNGENLRISENSGGGGHVDIDTNLIVDGSVGIGVTSPDIKLDVVEAIRIQAQSGGTNNATLVLTARNGGAYGNSLTARSDIQSTTDGTEYGSDLLFKTTDSSNTRATRMTIDSSGNSTFAGNVTLSQPTNGSDAILSLISKSAAGNSRTSTIEYDADNEYMYFKNAGTTVAAMTSAGNVGIGTDSPDALLDVAGNIYGVRLYVNSGGNATDPMIRVKTDTNTGIFFPADDTLAITTGGSERMRITSNGTFIVNQTSPSTLSDGFGVHPTGSGGGNLVSCYNGTSGAALLVGHGLYDGDVVDFRRGPTQVGTISVTSSATSYNTSSDYRLKEDLQDFAGLDMISKIPVYDFKWKSDESRSYGVMAHELQEVLPQAVSGDKDAEEMQSVDYSKIVPLLVKSIQELKAEIELLKTQIN